MASLTLITIPHVAAAEGYVFRAKAAVIAGTPGTTPLVADPAPPTVGVNGYAGTLNGRDVWGSSDERTGAWAAFGADGPFSSGGLSRDDGKANREAQALHTRGAENLASLFCRSLTPVDGQGWHLSAFNELRFAIGALKAGTFQSGQRYWSSSELDASANVLSVSAEGNPSNAVKAANATYRTKCIRLGN